MSSDESSTASASTPSRGTLIKVIENGTKPCLSIETSANERNLAKCDPQAASPLYQLLPQELRVLVFKYACTQSPDPRFEYDETAYYYRPGCTARPKTHTSLLLTCRRAWLEANALPMQQAVHAFYFRHGPFDQNSQPDVAHEIARFLAHFRSLTTLNIQNVSHLHYFMHLQAVENPNLTSPILLSSFYTAPVFRLGVRPHVLKCTVRHCDWKGW